MSIPIFVSDSIANMVHQIYTAITRPELYDGPIKKRQRYMLYGQPGIGKEEQLFKVLTSNNQYDKRIIRTELSITPDGILTEQLINNVINQVYALESDNQTANRVLLVIRNAHLLSKHLNNDTCKRFALTLKELFKQTYIIAISDEPPKDPSNNLFYSQFDEFVTPILPTMDQLKELYQSYFKYITDRKLDNCRVNMTDADYLWLAQCSDYCTPRDVREFVEKIYYYIIDNGTTDIVIDRELLEDPDNKFMISVETGLLCITNRDTRQVQQMYDTITLTKCVPSTRKVKKRKIEPTKDEKEED